jgi:hypothetical protein
VIGRHGAAGRLRQAGRNALSYCDIKKKHMPSISSAKIRKYGRLP